MNKLTFLVFIYFTDLVNFNSMSIITQERYTEVTVNYIMCPHFCFAHVFVIVV